jgi:hypothetical protein
MTMNELLSTITVQLLAFALYLPESKVILANPHTCNTHLKFATHYLVPQLVLKLLTRVPVIFQHVRSESYLYPFFYILLLSENL